MISTMADGGQRWLEPSELPFAAWLRHEMSRRGLSLAAVADGIRRLEGSKESRCSKTLISFWRKGSVSPRPHHRRLIAAYFDVPVELVVSMVEEQHHVIERAKREPPEMAEDDGVERRHDLAGLPSSEHGLDVPSSEPTTLQLLISRRSLLEAVGVAAVAFLAGGLGTLVAQKWTDPERGRTSVDDFFVLYDSEAYAQAYNLGVEILSRLPRGSAEQIRWLNNTACVAVSAGMFETAAGLLQSARREGSSSDRSVLVESNLAYVRYYQGYPVREFVSTVERAAHELARSRLPDDGWLRLWSRETRDTPVDPPYRVLLQLYARQGRYLDAQVAGQADIVAQGYRAQGTRGLLGMIAPIVGEQKTALRYVDEITEEHNPSSSWDHMAAVRDLVFSSLTGASDDGAVSVARLINMAESAKGEYYCRTTLADMKYFLAADSVRKLRYELGRRTVAAYSQTSRANLGSIAQIRAMVS